MPEELRESVSIDEAEQHIVQFVEDHPYIRRLHDPRVRHAAIHSIVDQVLKEHEALVKAQGENHEYQATS